jgi:tRNA splicing endonuclease
MTAEGDMRDEREPFETEKRPSRRTVFTHISSRGAVTPVGAKMGSRFIS